MGIEQRIKRETKNKSVKKEDNGFEAIEAVENKSDEIEDESSEEVSYEVKTESIESEESKEDDDESEESEHESDAENVAGENKTEVKTEVGAKNVTGKNETDVGTEGSGEEIVVEPPPKVEDQNQTGIAENNGNMAENGLEYQ